MDLTNAITVRQAANKVGKCEQTIRRWIHSGALTGIPVGRAYLVDQRALEAGVHLPPKGNADASVSQAGQP